MNIDLNAIRERANAATKGPWRFHIEEDGDGGPQIEAPDPRGGLDVSITVFGEHSRARDPNTKFIAHAREDVPALLDLVKVMTGALLHLEDHVDLVHMCPEHYDGATDWDPTVDVCNGCVIDNALKAAGFPDQASRDAEMARRAQPTGIPAGQHGSFEKDGVVYTSGTYDISDEAERARNTLPIDALAPVHRPQPEARGYVTTSEGVRLETDEEFATYLKERTGR